MAKHPELVGEFLHVPGYVQATDPGSVGGGKLWIDTSAGSGNWQTKIRNAANTAWEAVSGGGAGATNFPALTDTPASYAGAANYKVVVNGTATGLIFIPDSAGGSFLPLAGGVMTGDIDFDDANEGIRFDDGNGVKFDGIVFDPLGVNGPEIIIGEEAPDVGGHPIIKANTVLLRIGEGAGVNFGAIEMWSGAGGGWEPIITSISDNIGDPFEISNGDHATNINGSETRPTYNGADLALLSDVPGAGLPQVTHYNVGVGTESISCLQIHINATLTGNATISAYDVIRAINGGAAGQNFQLDSSPFGGPGPGPVNAEPTLATLTFNAGLHIGVQQVNVTYGANTVLVPVIVQ